MPDQTNNARHVAHLMGSKINSLKTAWLGASAIVLALWLAVAPLPALLAQAGTQGQWRTLTNQAPINPVHVALMNNGEVLIVAGSGNVATETHFQAAVWNPLSETFQTQTLGWDMFCNGMVVLHDGRVFINGGNLQYDPFYGEPRNAVYDPSTHLFTDVEDMAHGRWYPTVTTLGDGRVMTFSGLRETGDTNSTVEIYSVGSGWSQEYPAGWTPPLYPRMHLNTDGRVFYAGSGRGSRFFSPATNTWTGVVATTKYTGTRGYGTSVLLPLTPANGYRPRVMIFGGASPATATTEIIDLSAPTPVWQYGPSMSQPRIQMSATLLPNGNVLAVGGSTNNEDAFTASLNADLYDPNTNTFSSAGANLHPRLYHSASLLLPDAKVLLMGGNPERGEYEQRLEIHSPAYLFDANGTPASRPTITDVTPGTVGYGATFQVETPNAAEIASVVLVRPGAATHAFDMEQRLVGLSYTPGNGVLNVTAPPNGNIAPPGYYMLFVLDTAGVPSVAEFVRLSTAVPTLSIGDVTMNEGNAGTASALFNVSLSPPSNSTVSLNYATANGTATAGSDYVANSGTLTFPPGTTSRTISVTINGDTAVESSETFAVNLSGASDAVIADGQGEGTILNDDTPPGLAVYDSALKAPKCAAVGANCDSGGSLVNGRDGKGPEPNQPNTIGSSCPDGTQGTYHDDESIDRLKVSTLDGSSFAAGKTVRLEAMVWAWTTPSVDKLELYYAANANNPSWQLIATLTPSAPGAQTLSATYALPPGTLQAVRGRFRYQGTPAACQTGNYDDHDDLIFAVGAPPPDSQPPTTAITAPSNGARVSATFTIAASANDNVGVSRVEFYIDGVLRSTDTTAPYGYAWNTTAFANGSHSIFSRAYDATNNVGTSATVNVDVNNQTAMFDAVLKAPKCGVVAGLCDSGSVLLNGRDGKGPEPNQPNTINGSCPDGTMGTYHDDESVDRIRVFTNTGSPFAAGKTVTVEATVWAWTNPSLDKLELYHAASASNPSWSLIATLTPPVGGAQTLSTTYALPPGTLQVVRARFRYEGSAGACATGAYDDHDDLIFAVQ